MSYRMAYRKWFIYHYGIPYSCRVKRLPRRYQEVTQARWTRYENQPKWGRTDGLTKMAHHYKIIVREMLRNNGL